MCRIVALLGMLAWMVLSTALWTLADRMLIPAPGTEVIKAVYQQFPGATIRQSRLRRGTGVYELSVRRHLTANRVEDLKMQVTLAGKIQKIERSLLASEIPPVTFQNAEQNHPSGQVQGMCPARNADSRCDQSRHSRVENR